MTTARSLLSKTYTAPSYHGMLGAVLASLWLSACQSPPSATTATVPQQTTMPARVATTTGNEAKSEVRFEPKPYVPTIEEQRQQAAARARQNAVQGNDIPYDTRYADPTAEAVDPPITEAPNIVTEPTPDVIIIPIPQEPVVVPPPQPPSHEALLEQARQHSTRPTSRSTSTNDNLPAFRNLMQVGVGQLSRGELSAAESSFTRAQRLAPQSSAVYFYLSQVALKKNQPHKAEAMARRGLSVSEDNTRQRALWQLILRAGQMQNNTRVVQEAQQALR